MPFGNKRSKVVDNLISLRKKYPDFVINGEKQLSLMKGNWGGIGTYSTTVSIVGYTLFGSYGKGKAAVLYRKCRYQ